MASILKCVKSKWKSNFYVDPNSSVDALKSVGLDSSFEGRKAYAKQHNIGGVPGSAAWGDAIRKDVNRQYR